MLRLSFIFFSLTVLVTLGLSYKLGLLSYTRSFAAEGEIPEAETPEGIASLSRSLKERAKQLEAKEAEINRRERTIADKETLFSQQVVRYEAMIKGLKAQVENLEALNNSKVESYRKIYEKMDAKKAALILDEMEPGLVSEILGEMRPQLSVDILTKMSIKKARLLTEKYLAKRVPASTRKKSSDPSTN